MADSAVKLTLLLISLTSCIGFGLTRTKRQLYREDIPHHRPLDGKYEQSPTTHNLEHDGGINIDFDGNIKLHDLNKYNKMIKFGPQDAIASPGPRYIETAHHTTHGNHLEAHPIAYAEQPTTTHHHAHKSPGVVYTMPVEIIVTHSHAGPEVAIKGEHYTIVTHNHNYP